MKSKGGRGKKADYSTVVMRIPTPLKAEVEKLVEEFYASLQKPVTNIVNDKVNKTVTGIQTDKIDKPVTSIDVLQLPPRIVKLLAKDEVTTVEELAERLKGVYLSRMTRHIPGIGENSVETLEEAYRKYRDSIK